MTPLTGTKILSALVAYLCQTVSPETVTNHSLTNLEFIVRSRPSGSQNNIYVVFSNVIVGLAPTTNCEQVVLLSEPSPTSARYAVQYCYCLVVLLLHSIILPTIVSASCSSHLMNILLNRRLLMIHTKSQF